VGWRSAASNPTAQLGLAGSNNGSNLTIARKPVHLKRITIALTRGRQQFEFGGLVPAFFNPTKTIALSQFGQATFTSLQTFPARNHFQLLVRSFANGNELALSLWCHLRARPPFASPRKLTLTLGFRDEFSTGWNEAHGRAAQLFSSPNGRHQQHTTRGRFSFSRTTTPSFLAAAAHRRCMEPPLARRTVIRGGFGHVITILQDALGYRADQNFPFNPTYSLGTNGFEAAH